jgi:hypothetical protein
MSFLQPPRWDFPRVFLSLTSPGRSGQEAFVAGLMRVVTENHMSPVRLTVDRRPSVGALDTIRQLMRSCQGTIVIAMARTHVVDAVEHMNGSGANHYRDRFLATEWIQVEAAIAYQLDHTILILREDLVHPAGLLDPVASGLSVCTFSLAGGGTEDLPRIAQRLAAFRASLVERATRLRGH